ncbi:ATP-binding protein [Stenotrophomonas sp. PD6]|uniref:ATP-binding protein n=1 Tax=Stenotrophomonas sp. PD6 TaxID=3368612 RepID=UPI003BA2DF3D
MRTLAPHDHPGWSLANERYLALSLDWLHLRLQALAPSPASAAAPPAAGGSPRAWPRWKKNEPALPALPAPDPAATLADVAAARDAIASEDPPPALLALAQRFGLDRFETDILWLCVAVELDATLPAAIAAAQDGVPVPTFALALRLFDDAAWDALSPHRPLRHLRLLEINQPGATALTAAALRADERIVNAVKGLNVADARLHAWIGPEVAEQPVSGLQQASVEQILAALDDEPGDTPPVVQLLGQDRHSRLAIASQVCARLSRRLHRIAAESLPLQRGELETLARLWRRESLLLPLAVYVEADEAEGERLAAVSTLLSLPLGPVFVGLRDTPLALEVPSCHVRAPLPTASEQYHAWREALEEEDNEVEAASLSSHFDLDLGRIGQAAAGARTRAVPAWDLCRDFAAPRLDQLAQRLEPRARWDDLMLSEEPHALLRQIAAQARERHRVYREWGYGARMNRGLGISALFAGESGTGKTMAAEVIANELRLHLYRIDLSSVVSKYIGETEKNLRRLFDAAEQGGALLFFDEADALFGKRSEVKDSHDRYANIEINYLLQRMESFSGLAILATNMKASLDNAFLRRLRFVVNFPYPGPAERSRIWRNALPAEVPRRALDVERLARFNLSGGNIHSIALNAAFAAAADDDAVDMPRMLAAVRAELRKLGRPVDEADFRVGAPAAAARAPA